MTNKPRNEKARAAKRAKTERMVARADRKRRFKRNVAVATFFLKSSMAVAIVGLSLCGLYLFACACLKVTNMVNTGWRVARAEAAAFIDPDISSAKMHGITFAPGWETAAPAETYAPEHLDKLVDKYAAIYDVDPGTLRGIITKESSWNPNAHNVKGNARGLGQLLPSTRRKLGISDEDAHNPVIGVRAAASWLGIKTHEQGGDQSEAVQSYYCGPSQRTCVGQKKGLAYLKDVVRKYDSRPPTPQIVAMNSEQHDG